MNDVDTLTQKITDLETARAQSVAESEVLVGLVGALRIALAKALADNTAPDLSGLIARIDAVTTSLNAETSNETAAATDPSATPPAAGTASS